MITMLMERLEESRGEESAFTTAELLGNGALALIALVAIWGALTTMGGDFITKMRGDLKL